MSHDEGQYNGMEWFRLLNPILDQFHFQLPSLGRVWGGVRCCFPAPGPLSERSAPRWGFQTGSRRRSGVWGSLRGRAAGAAWVGGPHRAVSSVGFHPACHLHWYWLELQPVSSLDAGDRSNGWVNRYNKKIGRSLVSQISIVLHQEYWMTVLWSPYVRTLQTFK